jgi:alpha-D-ribose 1-methylphosphonate 5-triphosphate diphosphatase
MSIELSHRAGPRTITNARIVTPEQVIENGYLVIHDGRIVEVGTGSQPTTDHTDDADGRLILPGLIDLHGDEFERYIFPRENARVDIPTALVSCDRGNVSNGITTKFHAVAFENAPDGLRSISLAKEVIDTVARFDGFLGDNRIHVRCEVGDDATDKEVVKVLDRDVVQLVSLMNHLPDRGQYGDVEQLNDRYGEWKALALWFEFVQEVWWPALDVDFR